MFRPPSSSGRAALPLLGSVLCLSAFWAIGVTYLDGYILDLGSISLPRPRHLGFLAIYSFFGLAAAALLASAAVRFLAPEPRRRRLEAWAASRDAPWIAGGMVLAFVLPALLRAFVLRGAPVTDDETAYLFGAELLASGRLSVPSHPMKLFFDQAFLVNDGRLYPVYFLGWPALLAAGVWLGLPGAINPLAAALTVPPLYATLRRLSGAGWAKLGLLVFVGSPFLATGAATLLSHTACLAALAWFVWLVFRARDPDALPAHHAGVALAFAVAFWIRPSSALGVGLPFLLWWALGLRALPAGRRRAALLAFALPAALSAAAFLLANRAQHGSFFTTGYHEFVRYIRANGYRFSGSTEQHAHPGFQLVGVTKAFAASGIALFRANFAYFGWPSSLLLAACCAFAGPWRVVWLSVASFVAIHFFQSDSGVDTFGPVHYHEMVLPVLLLTMGGAQRLRRFLAASAPAGAAPARPWAPAALVAAFVAIATAAYTPVALVAVNRVAENINLPRKVVAQAGLGRAVVFSPWPFAPPCQSWPTQHFVFFRPANDPDLRNDVLWVNHVTVDEDRRLMSYFPDRKGFLLHWLRDCRIALVPLEDPGAAQVPDQKMVVGR